jgi:D-alanyl-lipoteichoic acid acyltransferase DltB (MBOAT superfamily)
MLFNSYEFLLVFLPLFLLGMVVAGRTAVLAYAVLMSMLFYGYSSVWHLCVFVASVLFNWMIAPYVVRRGVLAAGIAANLGLLFWFKYAGFASRELQGIGFDVAELQIALPIAISFYTFQQISFLVDTARSPQRPAPDFLTYATYVTFFPQLVAGPIVRFHEVAHRLRRRVPLKLSASGLRLGLAFVAVGLAKKVLIADTLAEFADAGFSSVDLLTVTDAWIAVLAFGLQIYFDFSAYSDIAIGLAFMVGIRLPDNFLRPYRATDIVAFWGRWHVTLSRFLRDYLYIPLGGNRRGPARTFVNLMVVMALGGLWHGANWTFLLWGLLHGFYLVVQWVWRALSPIRLPAGLGWLLTFTAVMLAWIPFRAESLQDAATIATTLVAFDVVVLPHNLAGLASLLGIDGAVQFQSGRLTSVFALVAVAGALLIALAMPGSKAIAVLASRHRLGAVYVGGLMSGVLVMLLEHPNVFIYFNF